MSKQLIAMATATVVVILIAAQSMGLFGGGSPTLMLPSCFPFIVLTLMGTPRWLVPFIWGGLFVSWHPALLRGAPEVPARSTALWLAVALLSGAYFAVSLRAGLTFEGPLFVGMSFALDLVLFGVCSALLWRARKTPSFDWSLRLHASLFIWISTYAFPYFGSGVIG
jgi:hypothetical protein